MVKYSIFITIMQAEKRGNLLIIFEKSEEEILQVKKTGSPVLFDLQSALDLRVYAFNEGGFTKLIIMKQDIDDAFFDFKTGIADDIEY